MTRQLIALTLLLGALYGGIEAWPLLAGPSLTLTAPTGGATAQDGIVTVSGRALRVAKLTLNGAPLLHDQNGDFLSTLTYPVGGTILTLEATDRFGRTAQITRSLFVPPLVH